MRFEIVFDSNQVIKLPIQYNYIIQSMIYRNLEKKYSNWLHNKCYAEQFHVFRIPIRN